MRRVPARQGTAGGLLWAALTLLACTDDRRDKPPPPARDEGSVAVAPAPQVSAAAPAASPAAPASPAASAAPAQPVPSSASLLIPVQGVDFATLRDSYDDVRGSARHEALDIMAPRGTPVLAVADGRVVKLFTSVPGGLTVYQFDRSGAVAYYYAHLDRYADGLREGMELRRGDPIGSVGSTGNAAADAPHLHFAVFVLGSDRQWWKGTPVNPYPLFAAPR